MYLTRLEGYEPKFSTKSLKPSFREDMLYIEIWVLWSIESSVSLPDDWTHYDNFAQEKMQVRVMLHFSGTIVIAHCSIDLHTTCVSPSQVSVTLF